MNAAQPRGWPIKPKKLIANIFRTRLGPMAEAMAGLVMKAEAAKCKQANPRPGALPDIRERSSQELKSRADTGELRWRILTLLRDKPGLRSFEVRDAMGVKDEKVRRQLARLFSKRRVTWHQDARHAPRCYYITPLGRDALKNGDDV